MGDRTCSVDGCGKPIYIKKRALCKAHYGHWQRNGGSCGDDRTCSVADCDEKPRGLKTPYCQLHYTRARAGHPLEGPRRCAPSKTGRCAIEGCPRRPSARGWCGTHYTRWKKYGDPLIKHPGFGQAGADRVVGADHHSWIADVASYQTVHHRLARYGGKPARCEYCNADGRIDWALDWNHATDVKWQEVSRRGRIELMPFSAGLSDYIGLCRPCHFALDRKKAAERRDGTT